MNSLLSASGSFIRPARQSALACSIRSREEETKFHSMKRLPTGAPPRSMSTLGALACTTAGACSSNTIIWPATTGWPSALAGESFGVRSKVKTLSPLFYAHVALEAASSATCA